MGVKGAAGLMGEMRAAGLVGMAGLKMGAALGAKSRVVRGGGIWYACINSGSFANMSQTSITIRVLMIKYLCWIILLKIFLY